MKNIIFVTMLAIALVGCDTFTATPNVDGGTSFTYDRTDFLVGTKLVLASASDTGTVTGFSAVRIAKTDTNHIALSGPDIDNLVEAGNRGPGTDTCVVNLSLVTEDNVSRHFEFTPGTDATNCASMTAGGWTSSLVSLTLTQDVKYPQQFDVVVTVHHADTMGNGNTVTTTAKAVY